MRPAIFISLLLAAPAVWSQGDQTAALPADIIAECSKSADGDIVGLQELEAACPGLEHALVELGYAPVISESQLDALSVHSLVDLQQLADRYRESPAGSSGEIETASLKPILESLQRDERSERPLTLFERIKKWLRSVFDKPQSDSQSWLNRWFDDAKVSEAVRRAIIYGLVILVIVLAVAVLVNELRAAGLLRRKARGKDAGIATDAAMDPATRAVADLDAVAPNDRPSVLLRMLVATLVKTGRLRTERSLTHRELGVRAAFDEAAQRECFQQVAALGERAIYGDGLVRADEVETIVQAGRALNRQLAAHDAAAPGGAAT